MILVAYDVMKFGEKLEFLIEHRGTSQSRLSRMTGIAQPAISAMTRGDRRAYVDQAMALARALGVSLDYLADDEQNDIPLQPETEAEKKLWEAIRILGAEEVYRRVLVGGGSAAPAPQAVVESHVVLPNPPSRNREVG